MNVAMSLTGSQILNSREYDIAAATAVSIGQVVKLSAGKVVLAVVGETGAILGVAAENHSGSADALNPRSNGTRIKVWDDPMAMLECPAPRATATGGSTTTFVVSGLSNFADDDFNGGFLKLVSKVAGSTNVDAIGTLYEITDFTNATGTFTIAAIAGAFSVGDICEIYPPTGFQKGNLDAGISKLALTASAALPIRVNNRDTNLGIVQFDVALHAHANKLS